MGSEEGFSVHPSDDDFVLHFYGDKGDQSEALIDEHLQSCESCRNRWQELTDALRLVDDARIPEPADGFEAAMWQRIQPALPSTPPNRFSWLAPAGERRPIVRWIVPAMGLAAAVIVSLVAGRIWFAMPHVSAPATSVRAAADPEAHEQVLYAALDGHFERSEMLLVELTHSSGSNGEEFQFERQTAEELLESNRLYRTTAQRNGQVQLAQMLEDLESVLVQIARSPEHLSQDDFRGLRTRVDDSDLLFKVRAVSREVQDRRNLN